MDGPMGDQIDGPTQALAKFECQVFDLPAEAVVGHQGVEDVDQIWIAGASCRLVGTPPPEGAVGDVGSCSGNSVAVGWGSGVGGSVVGSSPAHIAYAGWVGSGHPWRTPGGGSIGEMSAEGWGRYP